jgi:polysaccharide transporter, PST family
LKNENTKLKLHSLIFKKNKAFLGGQFNLLVKDKVFTDVFSLGVLQSLNLIIPLLLVPFLIKVYGIQNYGWITICQSFANYVIIFTDYGFNLTAVRDVVAHSENKEKLSSLFISVTAIKMIFITICFFLLLLSKIIFPQAGFLINVFFLSILGITFQILFPLWFFHGIGKLKLGTGILLAGRLLHAILIFAMLSSKSSLGLFFYTQSISYLFVSIISVAIIYYKYNIGITKLKKHEIVEHIKEGWVIYISNMSVNIYTGSSPIILGIFHNPKSAAIFGIADQILMLLRYPSAIFIRVIYPKICLLASEGSNRVKMVLKKYIIGLVFIYTIICTLVFVLAPKICYYFSKDSFHEAAVVVRLLCFLPISVLLLNTPPYLIFLAYKLDKINAKIITAGAVIGLGLNLIFSFFFKEAGSAVSIIVTELFVGIALYLSLKKIYPTLIYI